MTRALTLIAVLALAGCAALPPSVPRQDRDAGAAPLPDGILRPNARPAGVTRPAPPPDARSAEAFDTTTTAERRAAADASDSGRLLGETVVSLGAVTRSGFWLETPLVAREGPGRVVDPASGASARVTLIPAEGGSRLSLAAMRLMGLPLAGLSTVAVYDGRD